MDKDFEREVDNIINSLTNYQKYIIKWIENKLNKTLNKYEVITVLSIYENKGKPKKK